VGYALGIDLGTSATAAAIADQGRIEMLDLGAQGGTMPSLVLLREDGEALVGEAAERRASADPSRLARAFKRRFGDPTPIVLGGTPFGADALVARVWAAVVARATERMGAAPEHVALTHPASYGPYKMELLQQAARQAGIERPVFLAEPEAAAIQYATLERIEDGSVIAVYDFGGGTFDATVLKKQGAGFEVLGAPEGLERLGGADFDDAVLEYAVEALRATGVALDSGDGSTRVAMARLREECRLAKEALSEDTEATIPVMLPGLHTQVRLTRSEFEGMIRPRVLETTQTLQRAVHGAGLHMADVDRIVLVGGTSRIPLVAEMVASATGRPVAVDVHPKQVVALGAARVAQLGLADQQRSAILEAPAARDPVDVAAVSSGPATAGSESRSPVIRTTPPRGEAAEPVHATQPTRKVPSRILWAGGAVVALAVLGGGAFALFGGGGAGDALAAEIDDIELVNNRYQVNFTTSGFRPSADGRALAFYWDTSGVQSGTLWTSSAAFTGFTPAGRPSANARICVVVIEADGTILAETEDCRSVG
jgi:molecular chaperone DnaK (HSP70)